MRTVVLTLLLSSLATVSTAGDFSSAPGVELKATTNGVEIALMKLSTGVCAKIKYASETYAGITKHISGTKEYGTSGGATRIYFQELATGTVYPDAPATSDTTAFSTWSSL